MDYCINPFRQNYAPMVTRQPSYADPGWEANERRESEEYWAEVFRKDAEKQEAQRS